jgi:hypothetical protein
VHRYQGKPAFVHAAPGQSFTDAAMGIADALDGEHFNSLADQVPPKYVKTPLMDMTVKGPTHTHCADGLLAEEQQCCNTSRVHGCTDDCARWLTTHLRLKPALQAVAIDGFADRLGARVSICLQVWH